MKRRDFLAASCVAGAGAVSGLEDVLAAESGRRRGSRRAAGQRRDIFELRQYQLESQEQVKGLDEFLSKAMVPALNRLGIDKVGVFGERKESESPTVYVLIRHKTARSVFVTTAGLLRDEQFLADGKAFLSAGNENLAYKRIKTVLLQAFTGMRLLETPTKKDTRVFQLRIYESPTVLTGQKKIEMFNVGEIDIFRKTGLDPVFFGEAITGDNLPNLTYMLGFDDEGAQKKAWSTFVKHPDWIAIKSKPEYADKKILCGITNILLKPAPYSQI